MKQSIGSSAIKLTLSKMVTLIISMVVAMLLSRFRTLEEYGTYSQLLLIINLVTVIFTMGIPNSTNFFLARAETMEDKKVFMSTYLCLNTFLSVLMGVCLFIFMPLISAYFHNDNIKLFAFFLVIYPWTRVIMGGIDNILIVLNKPNIMFIFRLVNSFMLLADVVIIRIVGGNFIQYMILLVITEVICTLAAYGISFRLVGGFEFSIQPQLVKKILSFSIPLGLASVIGTLCTELDKLFVGYVYDTEQLAIYSNAARELPVTIVAAAVSAVVMPEIVKILKKNDEHRAIDLWKHSVILSYILICFIVFGVFTYAKDVMIILYSEKYISGINVFRVYVLMLLCRCTYFGTMMNAKGRTQFIFYSSFLSLILNVVLNVICYLCLGYIGPAVATLLSMVLIIIIQLLYTARIYNTTFLAVFPWKKIGQITMINVSLGVVFYMIKELSSLEKIVGSQVEAVLLAIVWGGIYLFVMRGTIKNEWEMLNG